MLSKLANKNSISIAIDFIGEEYYSNEKYSF